MKKRIVEGKRDDSILTMSSKIINHCQENAICSREIDLLDMKIKKLQENKMMKEKVIAFNDQKSGELIAQMKGECSVKEKEVLQRIMGKVAKEYLIEDFSLEEKVNDDKTK